MMMTDTVREERMIRVITQMSLTDTATGDELKHKRPVTGGELSGWIEKFVITLKVIELLETLNRT